MAATAITKNTPSNAAPLLGSPVSPTPRAATKMINAGQASTVVITARVWCVSCMVCTVWCFDTCSFPPGVWRHAAHIGCVRGMASQGEPEWSKPEPE